MNFYVINKDMIAAKEDLINFLKVMDNEFPKPLSKKVKIEDYIEKLINNGIIIVSKDKNNIVGLVAGYINDYKECLAYISIIAVKNEYRSKHIGKKLLNIFENIALKNGMKNILLTVHRDNKRAIEFYKKNNYSIDDNMIANYENYIVLNKKIELNILLTSVGRRGYLVNYFKEQIGNEGKIFVANSSDISPAFIYADECIVTPMIYDENYIEFLVEYCLENRIKAIISLFDIDLPILSKNKKIFEEYGITIIVSASDVVNICNDKYKTYLFLKENDFHVKNTFVTIKEALIALEKNIIKFPLIIKPRWGMGSISVLEACNKEELNVLYNKTLNNIKNTYLRYESKENMNEAILIQEKINGQEYGLDVINDLDGNYKNTIVKKKIAMRSGETDCAVVIENEELQKIGEELSSKIHHIGNMDVDLFLENDKSYILEMNARFGGGYPFSHVSGVNLPGAIIKWLKNETVPESYFISNEKNCYIHKDINIIKLNKNI